MIQIRNGVFETNSSSSHSIVVTKKDAPLGTVEGGWRMKDDGGYRIYNEDELEFGRTPFDILCDWHHRLRYAIASLGESHIEEIEDACRKHVPGFTCIELPQDRYGDGGVVCGYVDHQSFGLLRHLMESHNVSVEDFIFNDKYIVIIDGDEYCVFDRLCNTPLWKESAVDYVE